MENFHSERNLFEATDLWGFLSCPFLEWIERLSEAISKFFLSLSLSFFSSSFLSSFLSSYLVSCVCLRIL